MAWCKLERGKLFFSGSVSRDAEISHVGADDKACCKFSAAYEYDSETRKAVYVECVAWNMLAFTAVNIKRGCSVMVTGRMKQREYNGKTYKDLVCDCVMVTAPGGAITGEARQTAAYQSPEGFTQIENDELPF